MSRRVAPGRTPVRGDPALRTELPSLFAAGHGAHVVGINLSANHLTGSLPSIAMRPPSRSYSRCTSLTKVVSSSVTDAAAQLGGGDNLSGCGFHEWRTTQEYSAGPSYRSSR